MMPSSSATAYQGGVCGASETLLFSIGAGSMGEGLISHAPIGGAGPCGPGIV